MPGIELLLKVVPVDNIIFGSEMVGAVKGIDPETGQYFDDTKRYIDQIPHLSDEDRYKLYEGNARKVYPGLARHFRQAAENQQITPTQLFPGNRVPRYRPLVSYVA